MDVQAKPCYKRILLKLSGEALMGEDSFGINRAVLQHMIEELRTALDLGVQVGIVVGGGNIFRGVALGATGMDRATGDYMGMLATVMNAMSPNPISAARRCVICVSAALLFSPPARAIPL